MRMQKKGNIMGGMDLLLSFAFVIAILGFVISFTAGFMADELTEVTAEHGADSVAAQAINESLQAEQDLAESQTTVVGAGILFVVLAILIGIYAFYRRSGVA